MTVDGFHPISCRGIEMQRGLGQILVRYWEKLWRRFSPVAAEKAREEQTWPAVANRSRFWRELREGQREAEAHAARSRP